MLCRTFVVIAASLAPAPSITSAGTWTATKPMENQEYQSSSMPAEVTYDWGTGTAATAFEILVEDADGNDWMHTTSNLQQSNPTVPR